MTAVKYFPLYKYIPRLQEIFHVIYTSKMTEFKYFKLYKYLRRLQSNISRYINICDDCSQIFHII